MFYKVLCNKMQNGYAIKKRSYGSLCPQNTRK